MAFQLVCEPTGLEPELLLLDAAAAASYYRFLSSDQHESVVIRDILFREGLAECSPPACQLAVSGGILIGMYCASTGASLRNRRLRGMVRMARLGVSVAPAVLARARVASTSLARLEDDDWYLSRIAVAPELRGTGVGRDLLTHFIEAAGGVQARRCILEVDAANGAAIALYMSAGFQVEREASAYDPSSDRTLSYLHMTLNVVR